MSWELTGAVLRLRNLTPTEKAVAHSLDTGRGQLKTENQGKE